MAQMWLAHRWDRLGQAGTLGFCSENNGEPDVLERGGGSNLEAHLLPRDD